MLNCNNSPANGPDIVIDGFIPKRSHQHAQDEIKNAQLEGFGGLLGHLRSFLLPVEQLFKICEEMCLSLDGDNGSNPRIRHDPLKHFAKRISQEHRQHLLRALAGVDPEKKCERHNEIRNAIWDVRHGVARLNAVPLAIDAVKYANKRLGHLTVNCSVAHLASPLAKGRLRGV